MQKSTTFGIKVSIGSALLLYILALLSYAVFGDGYRNAVHTTVFIGTYTAILSFISTLLTAKILLKNSNLSPQDTEQYLDRGWRIYAGIGAGFLLLNITQTLNKGMDFFAFSVLSIATGSAAFLVLKARR